MFDKDWFFNLEKEIRKLGADSDAQSFDEIRKNLSRPRKLSPTEFADMCNYVILAGGFSQKTAKKIHGTITDYLHKNGAHFDELFAIFHNKNALCAEYYGIDNLDDKIKYLSRLPHIGKITANHLARNLGVDVVKYDIWIRRLGAVYGGIRCTDELTDEIKTACDNMFAHLVYETGLPRGYIDVVLWKSAQIGLIKL